MVSEELNKPKPPKDFVSSFQVLHFVADALSKIMSGSDAALVTASMSRIHQRFKECESTLDSLPGGSMTRKEQLEEIERLRESLQRKRDLLDRYSKHEIFSQALSQQALPDTEDEGQSGVENVDSNPNLNSDNGADRGRSAGGAHTINDPDPVVKMDDDFGDISGVPDSLTKDSSDDVLMGLEI